MNWQVKYALANFSKEMRSTAEHVDGNVIRIMTHDRPDVLAAITDVETVNRETAVQYREQTEGLDFLCGYRKECVWEGEAIRYLEDNRIGWGSFGTLVSAVLDGNANTATHKTYKFSDRLLRQYGPVMRVDREFDRVHRVTLRSRAEFRIGMIAAYEPTADEVRSLWERFGGVDIAWNINPNGTPQPEASAAGRELGCEVMKWDELKDRLSKA
ncbi:hypothetical protein PH5382_00003 [Phaeobacter sp. CECT 5382]|uniref:hypothetical protein n=1 Tax=Phaeobacter sp. CECT 5382 TaxID=1712645 RepID=UPI0006DA7DCA|nr:hypothetical protein [Phaeobacter sp. CECT 5382]CUH86097.1 hypothetical protein PH5382_00003 [Phaeobacter sp. CECT 5382]